MTAYAMTAPVAPRVHVRRVVSIRPVPTAAGRARRSVLVLVLLGLLALAVVALLAPRAFAGDETIDGGSVQTSAFDTYTVAQGESLWSIAAAITGPGEDVRDTMSQLQTLNSMGDSSLRAGEQIHIPALER